MARSSFFLKSIDMSITIFVGHFGIQTFVYCVFLICKQALSYIHSILYIDSKLFLTIIEHKKFIRCSLYATNFACLNTKNIPSFHLISNPKVPFYIHFVLRSWIGVSNPYYWFDKSRNDRMTIQHRVSKISRHFLLRR